MPSNLSSCTREMYFVVNKMQFEWKECVSVFVHATGTQIQFYLPFTCCGYCIYQHA